MRYAIFSDIHANLQAWEAIRKDMVALEADVLVCLGDVIGYGPLPEQVLTEIRQATNNFVLGNHDAAAVGIMDPKLFNRNAEAIIRWTSDQLSEDSKAFLLDTPLTIEDDGILFVHAEIAVPGRFGYIENADQARENFAHSEHHLTFIGHTHHPTVFDLDAEGTVHKVADEDFVVDPAHRYIINVGSVGEPRNPDDIRARYVIYDSETRQVWFRRVEFDTDAYRQALAVTTLGVVPFFLQVVDHYVHEAEAHHALMMDMRVPDTTQGYVAHRPTRKPVLYHSPPPRMVRPLPMAQKKPRNAVTLISIFVVLGLMVALAAMMMRPSKPDPKLAAQPNRETPEEPRRPARTPARTAPRVAAAPTGDAPSAPVEPEPPEPEPIPEEPEPVIIKEDGPVALQFDLGGTFTRYEGSNSPAHAEGILPESYTNWISVNDGKANGGQEQDVQTASGDDYPNPIRIELGCEVLGRSDLDALQWSASTEASDPPEADGIFGTDLMDGIHSKSGNKTLGVRVAGLEPGTYTVYITPATGVQLGRNFEYAIGIDKADDSVDLDRLGKTGLKGFTYKKGTATLSDTEWKLDQNYVKQDLEVSSTDDYVVALIALAPPKAAILPYLQIVKHEG